MPGLFDNSSNPISGILGGIGAALNPEYAMQKRGLNATYNALKSSGFSDDEATAATLNPQAAQEIWQRKIFQQQFESLRNSPGPDGKPLGDAAAYGVLTNPEAAKAYYGYQQLNGLQTNGTNFPGPVVHGGGIQGVPVPQVAGQPAQQPQPTQQPSGVQAPPAYQQYQALIDWAQQNKARESALVKGAEQTATAQPDLPILQNRAEELKKKLVAIRDNPNLPNVVGGFLGIKGRLGPMGQGQSDLLSDIQDANNALQGDLFTLMRTMSNGGRPPTPGAMKEMRITDLNARTGTVEAYRDNINKTLDQIDNEYEAAWKARNSPEAYKPIHGPQQAKGGPVHVNSEQDHASLKSGTQYYDPQGVLRIKR